MATEQLAVGGHERGFGQTHRTDAWWVGPAVTFTVLSSFVVYSTWALWQASHYYAEPYLSPLYSPVLLVDVSAAGAAPAAHAWFGSFPDWWPSFLPASPAILILAFPGMFRLTCYYYRKAYYRSFALSPPGCAVNATDKGPKSFKGETRVLLFQNLHRYALYFALIFNVILFYDAVVSFFKEGVPGVGVGSIVLTINACLLAGYSFGCHSFRHLVGGGHDCMSCGKATPRYVAWKKATWFNERHMKFAWASLVWVGFTDLYVRLVSMGVIHDFNTWS